MRTTCPEAGNKYYIRKVSGGWSDAIKGSPTHANCDVLSNCVGYAYGRFNEIGNYGYCKYLSPVNAERFPQYNNTGLEMGTEPALGACMVWRGGPTLESGDGVGHVAIVEKVISPTEVYTSESGWGSSNPFWNTTRKKGTGNWGAGNGYTFLGFIYNPAITQKGDIQVANSNSSLVTYTNISNNKTIQTSKTINRITIHCIVGQWTAKQGCDYFATANRQCSANYVVGKDGSIGLSVDEKDRSWCSSSADNDKQAITIEVASDTTDPYAVTSAAYTALLNLVADICKRNGKNTVIWNSNKTEALAYKPATNEVVLTVHRWFASKSCPGEYLYSRQAEIANTVTQRLGGTIIQEEEEMTQEQFNTMMNNWITEQANKDPGTWSAEDRTWAEKNGYVNGDNNGRMMYKKFLTREEMVAVLHRFANKIKSGLE